jgi:hypothetical protein
MTKRKKKLRIIQFSLLLFGCLIIFFTYLDEENVSKETILSKETQEKLKKQLSKKTTEGDVFYNIEYSGLDLSGNRYILKSKEAVTNEINQEIIKMKSVEAMFYFKDDTTMRVVSREGIYNNKTLDMIFTNNVKAFYEGSELLAEKAEFSNLKSFLTITKNVIVKDIRGTMFADKLLFDIKKQKLNISSINDNKINANINLK